MCREVGPRLAARPTVPGELAFEEAEAYPQRLIEHFPELQRVVGRKRVGHATCQTAGSPAVTAMHWPERFLAASLHR
jgi:hypothetical protein